MKVEVTTTHLDLTHPSQLRPKRSDHPDFAVRKLGVPLPAFNRFLYETVGRDWRWVDRLAWSETQWADWVQRPQLHTWVGYAHGTPAGYFELEEQADGDVEIAYFGLLPAFIGQGLGGQLLSECVECAWALGAKRVWVHTCSLDHPGALANYRARGFRVFREDIEVKEIAP